MRIKELADLTGTTVRAVRHYHHLGLLPVPNTRFGYRDYDLVHVARVTRIRWLANSGVPLSTVRDVLGDEAGGKVPERESVLHDLRQTMQEVDARLSELHAQRDRIGVLVESIEAGGPLSPMPATVVRFYETVERRAPDERTRRAIRAERDFTELSYFRGEALPGVEALFDATDDDYVTEGLELYARLGDHSTALEHVSADAVARSVVARMSRKLGDRRDEIAASMDPEDAQRLADLYLATLPDHTREAEQRIIVDALMAALREWGGHD